MAHRGILVDVTKCIGCGSCVEACQKSNQQPAHEREGVERADVYLPDGPRQRHLRPPPVHALRDAELRVGLPGRGSPQDGRRPVVYDARKCMGCRYCMMACPFGVPTYEWDIGDALVHKCQMCARRGAAKGRRAPRRVPTGATIIGDRDELLAEARRRVAGPTPRPTSSTSTASPRRGDVRALSSAAGASPRRSGCRRCKANGPLPDLTWNALKHIPDVVLFGGVFLGGLFWLTKRKRGRRPRRAGRRRGAAWEGTHDRAAPAFWVRAYLRGVMMAVLGAVACRSASPTDSARVTNLSDTFPWGLWIGFDVLCGVGLAAGGFTRHRHRPHLPPREVRADRRGRRCSPRSSATCWSVVRAAVRPRQAVEHLAPDHHVESALGDVRGRLVRDALHDRAALEFAPIVFERFGLEAAPLRILQAITSGLVILGVILSTLHQSSLGTLYLIVPDKLHPLWYTPVLPVFFFISALAVGIAMTIVESWFSRRAFGKPIETHLLPRLSRVSVVCSPSTSRCDART